MTARPAGWLADQLPEALGAGAFARNFLAIFEEVAGELHERIEGVQHHLDAALAPSEDLGWLATWLAQSVDGLPTERQREVIAVAGNLLPWRGTARWLQALLTASTAAPVEVADTGGVYLPGHWRPRRRIVTVRLTDTGGLKRRQLERLIHRELPVDAELDLQLPTEDVADGPPAGPAPPTHDPTEMRQLQPDRPSPEQQAPTDESADVESGEWLPPMQGPLPEPSPGPEQPFTVDMECESMSLTRREPLRCWLTIHNRTDQADEFTVTPTEQAANWIVGTPVIVALAAGEQEQVPVDVVAPSDVDLQPGSYTVGVKVTASLLGTEPQIRQLAVNLTE